MKNFDFDWLKEVQFYRNRVTKNTTNIELLCRSNGCMHE